MDEQDTRQSTELKKSVVQSVLLCLTSFHVYFDKQVHKKLGEKIKQASKKKKKQTNKINK